MNNERPMDILDAIINKKLYKIGNDNQHEVSPTPMSFTLNAKDAFAAYNDVFGSSSPPVSVETRALDRGTSSPAQSAPVQMVSAQTTSSQAAPAQTASSQAASAQTAPAQTASSQAASAQTALAQTVHTQAAPAQTAHAQTAPAAEARGGRDTEDNSPWKEASFFAGVGNDKFAVFNTRDNVESTLQRIGINLGGHRINIEPGKAALLELNNGARVVVYSDANGNKQLIISDPEKLGARVPGNNLQALPPAIYSLIYRNQSNNNNASLGATQGVQSYDPTQLFQQLLAALIQAINTSGSNNNVLGNDLANSILSNIPITSIPVS
jgi:hypothetical protein